MKKTVILPDKRHSIPKCISPFIESLKNLEGIVRVGIDSFGNKSKYSEFQWKPQTTDSSTNTVKLNIRYQEFSQDLWITLQHARYLPSLVCFLNSYKP
ncbi:hypothetical protein HYW75_00975 [Candidatus Pacearchaeota archaeon]|nr:hypothetical protein [Candidatus Pacearchaeota archaeon]